MNLRHNELRNTEAEIMAEIAYDVRVEPELQDIPENLQLSSGTILADGARLDVSARGIFRRHELTFFDVRVTNPNCSTNQNLSLRRIYESHEKQKMTAYNDRVLQVEKASFVPLVYTTTGGMSPQCKQTHERIAHLIAEKRNESYADVATHLRTRLRFSLLRSTL